MKIALLIVLSSATLYLSGKELCDCESFEPVFKEYRTAKDAGDLALAEQIALRLSTHPTLFCRIQGLNLLANVKVNSSEIDRALLLIKAQKRLLDSLDCEYENYLEYYLTKSYFHYAQDQYDSSIFNSLKALEIAEKTNAISKQITLRLGIGSAFYRTGQPEKKMEYARSIIPLIEQVDDLSFKCQYYFNLFGAYYTYYLSMKKDMPYLDSAYLYNLKALKIAKETLNIRFLPYCYEAMEIVNNERGGSPKTGLRYLDSALYFGRNSMTKGQISELLLNKATLYEKMELNEYAALYADSALYFSAQNPQKSVYASHLEDASELFRSLGEYEKALNLFHEANLILDSIKSTTNARTVRELEEMYHKEKNEKQILQLSQEKEISQLQIRLLIFGILIAIIGIILIVFIYRLSLLKQRQQAVESKYRLNQALINPHFLSNALVSIQRFIMENNPVEASNYLTRFSRLMRQLLESSYLEVISIDEEIDLIRNYLSIQKLRLKDAFEFEISVSNELSVSDSYISPMFIQPFVENAIEHGVAGLESGKIEITFTKQGDRLHVCILDNGIGLSGKRHTDQKSLSTAIIQERIQLLNKINKEKIALSIQNRTDFPGVCVELVLPISV